MIEKLIGLEQWLVNECILASPYFSEAVAYRRM